MIKIVKTIKKDYKCECCDEKANSVMIISEKLGYFLCENCLTSVENAIKLYKNGETNK